MEGGGMAGNFLDPAAQEFHPVVSPPAQFSLVPPPPIYYPYGGVPPAPAVPAPFYQQTAHLNPSPYVSPAAALPDTKPTRSLLLSSVPPHTAERAVRVEMEAFGGVRAVEMGRLHGEGLVTVHFYDLRSAQAALGEIREQHVRQQSLLGQQYGFVGMVPGRSSGSGLSTSTNWAGGGTHPLWAELGGSCNSSVGGYCGGGQVVVGRGLIAGRAVWAQFAPETAGLDGPNNGSLVVFNLDSDVSSAALKEVFQVFGAVKELRETPLKPRHRFVEFFDIRDAARALYEINGKEIFGKRVVIEFSRPGGQQARRCCPSSIHHPWQTAPHACSPRLSQPNTRALLTRRPPRPGRLPTALTRPTLSAGSYCRKGSAHQPTPLPPRLLRTTLFYPSNNPSSSRSGGAARSSPTAPVRGDIPSHDEAAADKGTARRGKSSSSSSRSTAGGAVSASSRHQSGRHKGWKNAGGKSRTAAEAMFHIKEVVAAGDDDVPSPSSCRDTRTTVMIKNIPNKYSQKLLLNMLDNHCIHCNERIAAAAEEGGGREPASAYDFVYLPIDFNNKCNVGYGFVNLTSPEATWRLYKAFHMQPWEVFNSRKICQVTYARLQGLEALKEHFKNSKFACDTDEYMPVAFTPPRDGKFLADPDPIGSRGGAAVLTAAGRRKMAALMEEMGAPFSDVDRPTDGGGCSPSSTTASTLPPCDQVEEDEEERRSYCSTTPGADDDARYDDDDDDNEGREVGGGGVGDMTDLITESLRHHHHL